MIDQIREVLSNWDYQIALDIFKMSGRNPSLTRILGSGESLFFRKKLQAELQLLMDDLLAKNKTNSLPGAGTSTGDETLSPVIIKRNTAVRRQDYLRGRLPMLIGRPPAEIYPVCEEILDLDDIINEQWKIIYYYREHGQLPPDEGAQIISKAKTWLDLVKIHSSYKTNVSKARNGKLPEEKLLFYQDIVSRCEKLLKQPITTND